MPDIDLGNVVGPKGNTGPAAGFGAVTATVDTGVGTPSVEVSTSGDDTAKKFHFNFHNLKGPDGTPGTPGASATINGVNALTIRSDDDIIVATQIGDTMNLTANKASLTAYGATKLSSAVDSTDQTSAATPSAVKQAYDLANTKKRTCRFTVGTSTAGWTAADVDYLCDGTADDVEINAAIQALPAGGGEIIILDGTYNITANIAVNKDNVTLSGNGKSTILKRMFNSAYERGLIHITSSYNAIRNLTIDGNKTNYKSENNFGISLYSSNENNIAGITCRNNFYGIYLNKSSNNTITCNTYDNNGNVGISLNSSSNNNTITENNCRNNSNLGITTNDSTNNTITGNTCNNNSSNGIYLYSSSTNTVTGNTCNNNSTNGIHLTSSSNNTITGNTCNNNSTNGIHLTSSSNNTITGNTCNGNTGNGIYLTSSSTNNTITGNTCNNNGYFGIRLNSSSNNNTITGNTCNGNAQSGIRLESSSNNTVTGNTCIRGNGASSDYSSSQYTIQISSGSKNLIVGNNILGKNYVDGGSGNTWANNKYQ